MFTRTDRVNIIDPYKAKNRCDGAGNSLPKYFLIIRPFYG